MYHFSLYVMQDKRAYDVGKRINSNERQTITFHNETDRFCSQARNCGPRASDFYLDYLLWHGRPSRVNCGVYNYPAYWTIMDKATRSDAKQIHFRVKLGRDQCEVVGLD